MPSKQAELHILLLEDEPTDAELTEIALREAGLSFVSRRVDTREAFVQALDEFRPDIVLADYRLPAFDGASAVKIVRQRHPDVPVIMLTGAMGDEMAVELLRLGAKDYILKDRLARLGPAVQRALSAEQGIRARKAAEGALRRSEAELRALVERSPIAMIVDEEVGEGESVVMMNRKFTELFGYTVEDVPDVRHWWPLAYPDEKYRESIRAEWTRRAEKAVRDRGEIEPMEATIACKGGSGRYVRVSFASIGNRNIVTFEDLTERRQAEERIRFSEALLRQAQTLAAVGSWRFYVPRNELVWSDETYRIFGLPPGAPLTYETFIARVHPDDRAMVDSAWQAALKGAPYHIQHRIVVNGATRWVEERAELEFDAHGNLFSSMGAVQDITGRRQMEDALREASERNQAIMETANDAIVCMRPDGVIHLWNHKAEEMFGYTAAEAIGRKVHELITPMQYRGREEEGLRKFAETGTGPVVGKPLEITALHKNGAEFPIELSISAMNIRSEWHATGIVRDITERKQAEARIRKLTRLYATLSQTNTTIVRSASRDELFHDICKAAVEHGRFVMAWVGLTDETARRVNPVCHYGAEQGYLENIFISVDDIPEGRGPTGTAIRENRVWFINDFAIDERAIPWREAALKRGFHSSVGLPLRLNGRVIGALTMYSGEPGFFDAEQLSLMEEMSDDISFALDGFEREARRLQAEEERGLALVKLQRSLEGSVRVAAAMTEVRDPYTAGHQQRVSQLAAAIAAEMGLPSEQVEGIRFGSLIHDIGKVGVPAEILSKPSKLAPLEMELIHTHPQAGYEIVKNIEFPWPVARMILQHHERLDGSGYPAGLRDGDILLEARVIAVADVVEAMSSHRPYRPGMGMETALAEIAGGSGTRYDRQAVEACLRLIREKGFAFKTD